MPTNRQMIVIDVFMLNVPSEHSLKDALTTWVLIWVWFLVSKLSAISV